MEQRRSEDDMKQQQDHHHRRLNPAVQSENQPHHPQPPQQPQKCPRCDSFNTKFCYYNNYSLSQPRYFCKACRRYWTQGGTLRNVPVGGGCRKAKRAKAAASSSSSSGGESSRSQPPPPLPTPTGLLAHHEPRVPNKEALIGNLGIPSMSSYNSGGGFLSSLAAMQFQSLTQQPPQAPFINQQVLNNVGAQFGASSNLSILSLSSQQQAQNQQQNHEFYHMGINRDVESLCPSLYQALIQPNRLSGSWINPNLISNTITSTATNNPTGSNPSFGNSSSSTAGTTSLNPNQWPDHHLPGYGSP